ncbi:conjugative transfer signal peptidase TraF [Pseudorhodoferax sp. Leaf267]|uniref:conjugative transfer signal peptidase TraF n=1 Tax=Pseudorhodoferax sp. Leaf267 TaxID=1736316 RepID=UPI0006F897DF|nr:conjugative transfer signal peptidase TraF [Pseudorhodoferax sp. Leaf267]KQP23390.1 conjugal transfer protein TraF [Pseudorhodoferax sp. Leaf267]
MKTPKMHPRSLAIHLRQRWYWYAPVGLIWVLAYVRLFWDPTPRLPLLFNWTPSLPYHVAWLQAQHAPLRRGDLIVFRFEGPSQAQYPGLRGQPFFKRICGLPGDEVTVEDRLVRINGEAVGLAKPHTFDRRPLTPIAPQVIPAGHYFVQGTASDSFDSRYGDSGLVRAEQVLGVVVPLF